MGIERLDAAEAREAEWVVKRDELRASLAFKDVTLAEVTARNAGLVFACWRDNLASSSGSVEAGYQGSTKEAAGRDRPCD